MCKIVEEEKGNDIFPTCCTTNDVGPLSCGVDVGGGDGGDGDGEGVGKTEKRKNTKHETETCSRTDREIRTNQGWGDHEK
jgi:hypothetical protein